MITDPKYRVMRVNKAAEEMTGFSAKDLVGKQWGIDAPHVQTEAGKAARNKGDREDYALEKQRQGGTVRAYRKLNDLTVEQRKEHRREQNRINKQKSRAASPAKKV